MKFYFGKTGYVEMKTSHNCTIMISRMEGNNRFSPGTSFIPNLASLADLGVDWTLYFPLLALAI